MSTISQNKPTETKHRRLTEPERRAIVAAVVSTGNQVVVAKQFGVHVNTVRNLVASVRKSVANSGSPLDKSWRQKLTDDLPRLSVDAIERSISDLDDKHKAANTAIAHLKGIGALQGEGNQSVNVFVQQVMNLPADLRAEFLSTDDVIDITPTSQDSQHVDNKDADSKG